MPGGSLGTIRGQIRLDVANAIAGYAAVRAANARTIGTMNDARNRMRGFGLAAVGMGALFLAGFGMAVKAAANFEKKLDYFGAVNNATAQEMEKVRAKALELGRTSQYSAGQVADAFVEMGKAGVSAKDITDGMADAMVNLAAAADIDLAQATNIVTSQIQAFALSAKDAVHVTDLMAGAANASIIDITDIGVSMKYVAGVAHALGISIDSTTDAIGLLGKAGIKGSTAGTSLRQIMVSLAGGTKKAQNVLKDLGIITEDGANKFFDAHGKAKSLAEVFQILQEHTAGLSDKERIMAMRTIFNNRALAAASILTRAGAAGFAQMNDQISKTTAADVAAKRMDNLAGDVKKLKGNLETMLIEGGTPFQEFLRGLVQGLTAAVQWFSSLPRWVQTSVFAFMAIAGVVLVVAGTIALMGAAISGAIGALASVGGAFRMLGPIIMAVTRATWAMTVAALANPYVLLAMAIVALIVFLVLLYKRSEAFRNFIDGVGRALKTAFFATVEWFKGLPQFFGSVWDSITKFFSDGTDRAVSDWNGLVEFITSAPGKIWDAIVSLGNTIVTFAQEAPGKVGNALSAGWSSIVGFLQELPGRVGYALGFLLGRMVRWTIDAVNWATTTGTNVTNAVTNFFQQLPGRIWTFLSQLWNDFQRWGQEMTVKAAKFSVDVYQNVVRWFQQLPSRIWNFLVDMKNKSIQQFTQFVSSASNFGSRAFNAVVNWFRQLPGRIYSHVSSMANRARSGFNTAVSWARNAGSNIYNGVINWVSQMPGKVWSLLGTVIQYFKDMARNAVNAARDFASGLWNGFKDGLGIHSPSYIEEAMWAITKVTGREATRLKSQVRGMQGLARGLQEVHDRASTAATVPWSREAAGMLSSQARSMFPSAIQLGLDDRALIRRDEGASTVRSEALQDQRPINITVNNPVAERASDSAARKLRTLSAMGAF